MLKEKEVRGIAVDEHAAVEIIGDEFKAHSYGPGGTVQICEWQNDDFVTETLSAET